MPPSGGLGGQPLDFGEAVGDARLALLRTVVDAVGVDELGLNAEEVEHRLQIGLHVLEAVAGVIESAARNGDDYPLPTGKPFGNIIVTPPPMSKSAPTSALMASVSLPLPLNVGMPPPVSLGVSSMMFFLS